MFQLIKHSKSSILIALLLVVTSFALANNDPLIEKTKSYSKSYNISNKDKINIENSFGEMKLITWAKNEIKVDVTITAKGGTEERAQQILDHISIEDGKNNSGVFFKTKMDENKKNWNKGDKGYKDEGMHIDYVVYLPASNPLDVQNSFGPMIIPDYNGEASISSKFGSLTAGKISNAKLVSVEFGHGEIESINNGKLSIQFSRATINKISGFVKAELQHSSGIKLIIDNGIRELTINNSFSTLYLDVNKNLGASFDLYTNFGSITNKTDFGIAEEKSSDESRGPKFDHRYSGKVGNGNAVIKLKSEFGNTIVGHDLEMKAEEKSKGKGKTRAV